MQQKAFLLRDLNKEALRSQQCTPSVGARSLILICDYPYRGPAVYSKPRKLYPEQFLDYTMRDRVGCMDPESVYARLAMRGH